MEKGHRGEVSQEEPPKEPDKQDRPKWGIGGREKRQSQ